MLEILQVHKNFSWSTRRNFWDVFSFLPCACAQRVVFIRAEMELALSNITCFVCGLRYLWRHYMRIATSFPISESAPLSTGNWLLSFGKTELQSDLHRKKVSELSVLPSTFFFFPLKHVHFLFESSCIKVFFFLRPHYLLLPMVNLKSFTLKFSHGTDFGVCFG